MKRTFAAAALVLIVPAAAPGASPGRPAALAPTKGGLWEISGAPGSRPVRLCVADPAVLAQFEHRGAPCTRVIIRDGRDTVEIHYTCAAGRGFGRSAITVLTPRSLRIDTQGISRNVPFHYLLQARRVGDCRPK